MASDSLSFVSFRTVSSYSKKFSRLNRLRRVFTVLMIAMLLSNPAAAAMVETTPIAISFAQDMRFAFYSSGWASFFGFNLTSTTQGERGGQAGKGAPRRARPERARAERREDLEAKISSVKIYPGDVEIVAGEQVVFTAVGLDSSGNSVGGLHVKWSALHEEKRNKITVRTGVFSSIVVGTYKISAEIAGKTTQVTVKVVGENLSSSVKTEAREEVDSRDFHKQKRKDQSLRIAPARNTFANTIVKNKKTGNRLSVSRAGMVRVPKLLPEQAVRDEYGFNDSNQGTFDDPGSERGDMPGRAIDGGAGSGNYQFSAPAVSLDGRGIDLNLAFNYNSRLWHKAGSEITFDIDRDWLPGWNIGFGKISMQGGTFMLTDADGTRHPYKGNSYTHTLYSGYPPRIANTFEAWTTDGTFINYFAQGWLFNTSIPEGKVMMKAWAVLPNGTKIEYGAAANYAMYPTRITDAHGNFMTITYLHNEGPNIQTITDTLDRTIIFNYDGSDLLTSITAPGLGGGGREIVRLNYKVINLDEAVNNYGFSGVTAKARNQWITVVRAIYYPATGTGYWFDDADSYSKYGMIRKVSERRGMTIDAYGFISPGVMSHEVKYSNPNYSGYNGQSGGH